ncbi:MAG TPA: PhnD/SsuA/transferrin family substrate-binding protein [Candidatus Eisenbacteria bacterium]|jgi:ABC-type phosphate/phosphonate transport system substrate-binding protein|nr:PhnD/SsuA/transferrin family substrate-binding protein [Candidatus Eisenbacteria bacterium]
MNAVQPIRMGAVIYDPKVTVIWGIIQAFFEQQGVPMMVRFYADYGLQVDALVAGQIDIAWNSPLAWLDVERRTGGRCRAIAMRDTDRDRVSHVVVRREDGLEGVRGLQGKVIGTGAKDSPQATLIPLDWLRGQGLPEKDYAARHFDIGVGLHGDHVGGELEAFRALTRGEVDASVMLDLNRDGWEKDGTLDPGRHVVLGTTEPFDHCNFSVLESFPQGRQEDFSRALFAMRYDNPKHREMMDLEGLKEWLPGRTSGYAALSRAVETQRFFSEAPLR